MGVVHGMSTGRKEKVAGRGEGENGELAVHCVDMGR